MNNCTPNITEGVQVFFMAVSIPTCILGFLCNITILVLFFRQWKEWNDMKVYLTNMAFADLCVVLVMPIKMYSYSHTWSLPAESCFVLVSTFYVNTYVSIYIATAISLLRCMAVKYPFRAKSFMSPRKALVVCVLIWLVICSLSAALHITQYPEDPENNQQVRCFQKNREKPLPAHFISIIIVVGYLIPLIIITCCYAQVLYTLSRKGRVQGQTGHAQSINIIGANLVTFIVCFLPFHFGFLFKYVAEEFWPADCHLTQVAHNLVHVALTMSNTNCCLDAISYYFMAKNNRRSVKDLCCVTGVI
ncbi:G-protein coupled receptor 35-like [Denticeps clupeoides]|uniref:G-protein coupled receptor 35-like n=2 Tax=Denticeps clupeoides TaxID=299321 RepID=UPI0010A4B513|nr:G-protein coupled receptor 35-like [Denticeps clupeoides]XP_028857420.1 G-protein coupled receptor 35-like [Denticeps clupeoides]